MTFQVRAFDEATKRSLLKSLPLSAVASPANNPFLDVQARGELPGDGAGIRVACLRWCVSVGSRGWFDLLLRCGNAMTARGVAVDVCLWVGVGAFMLGVNVEWYRCPGGPWQ